MGDARTDATLQCHGKTIAVPAGDNGIGPLVDSSTGIIKINPAKSTETSSEGNNDTTSCEKDIIIIVRAEYEVK
jgi:hypothetical protein